MNYYVLLRHIYYISLAQEYAVFNLDSVQLPVCGLTYAGHEFESKPLPDTFISIVVLIKYKFGFLL